MPQSPGQRQAYTLARQVERLSADLDAAKAALQNRDRDLHNLRQELAAAKQPHQPANLGHVTRALIGYVPTIPAAPGFATLAKAATPLDYAQGIHLLLLHARQVGFREGQQRR